MKTMTLRALARRQGIQTSYLDGEGRRHRASDETLRRLLESLGAAAEAPRLVEPVAVCWQARASHPQGNRLKLCLPAGQMRHAWLGLTLEDGTREEMAVRDLPGVPSAGIRPDGLAELEVSLPELPLGYHNLSVGFRGRVEECLLLSAPSQMYSEPGDPVRQWGLFLPAYAAHSGQSWGAGSFSDWRALGLWAGEQGARVLGALPVLAPLLDPPVFEPSPYAPASRLFWNEFFVDPTRLPEWEACAPARRLIRSRTFTRQLEEFRKSDWIDYNQEWQLRRQVLTLLAEQFFASDSPRRAEFEAYARHRPEVRDYAAFRSALGHFGTTWRAWPGRAQNGTLAGLPVDPSHLFLYAQWAAQQQMESLLRDFRGAGVKFYLDLPVGVHPDGYDAWRQQHLFLPGLNVGSPPDGVFTRGQDWGFAPLHPLRCRQTRYRYLIDYLRFQMGHTGLLRIDHAGGLHRLWCIPHGFPASEGAYLNYPAPELYALLALESQRNQTLLIGENLGTVPAALPRAMRRFRFRRMYAWQAEPAVEGPPSVPERDMVASLNTHDMPMFAGWYEGLDIADRLELGLLSAVEARAERRRRLQLRRATVQFLRGQGMSAARLRGAAGLLRGLLEFLGRSGAETVLVNLEDIWLEARPQNVPGTWRERPNWRRKAAWPLERILASESVRETLRHLGKARRTRQELL